MMKLCVVMLAAFAVLPSASGLLVAVTHAAGRMGVSVVGQLCERWQSAALEGRADDKLRVRAIVRSKEEGARLNLDLCGAVLRGGMLTPLLDLQNDLGVELCVVPDDVDEHLGLTTAFENVDVAVLLSAAHADFAPADAKLQEIILGENDAATTIVPGTAFHVRASRAFSATKMASTTLGINVRVPYLQGAAAARRLGAEIAAATAAESSSIRHVVLRSTMGIPSLAASANAVESYKSRQAAATAVTSMGGAAAIAVGADAETALKKRCEQRGISYTVLRLGALVDSAGGVPLAFGCDDTLLLERVGDGMPEPPLIARNDAARLVVDVVSSGPAANLSGAVVDVAWGSKWGMASAGTEEAARTAARQDVVAGVVGVESFSVIGASIAC